MTKISELPDKLAARDDLRLSPALGQSRQSLALVIDVRLQSFLTLEVDTSFASRRVTRVLDEIVTERGRPEAIRCDNGPEFTSRHFLGWCVERQIELEATTSQCRRQRSS